MSLALGNAALLGGSTQYFTRAVVGTAVNNFTLSAWINRTDHGTFGAIFENGHIGGATGWCGYVGTGEKMYVDIHNIASITGTTVLGIGIWYHVVFTRNAGNWQFYLNGVSEAVSNSTAPSAPATFTRIGADAQNVGGTVGDLFKGSIDDVRYYERALSTTEISQLYARASNPNIADISATSLVGWWKLDESSGNAADSSGGGLTMTNTGTATFTGGVVAKTVTPSRATLGIGV